MDFSITRGINGNAGGSSLIRSSAVGSLQSPPQKYIAKRQSVSLRKDTLTPVLLTDLLHEIEQNRNQMKIDRFSAQHTFRKMGDDFGLFEEKMKHFEESLRYREESVRQKHFLRNLKPEGKSDKDYELIPITANQMSIIKQARYGKPKSHTVNKLENPMIDIKMESLERLDHTTWLNDEVINFYLRLIEIRSSKSEGLLPRIYAFKTFFYTKLLQNGRVNHSSVAQWTRRINIFDMDKILIPINQSAHWTLCVVDVRACQIQYYDSMFRGRPEETILNNIYQYIQEEYKIKLKTNLDESVWTLVDLSPDVPRQENCNDCGVFACKFAERVSMNQPLNFSQRDIPNVRKLMQLQIINGELLNSPLNDD